MQPRTRGFTLVELLVVFAIIVVLAALIFGVTSRMILAAHKADSLNDLRTLGTLTIAASGERSGRLPLLHANMNNPHHYNKRNGVNPSADDRLTLEDLIEGGLTKNTAFCMANKEWSKKSDYFWNDFGGGGTAVFSYVYLGNDNGWADDKNRIEFPSDAPHLKMHSPRSVRGLPALPAHVSDTDVWYPYLWADLCRSFGGDFLANFMKNDKEPAGMNIMFLDGHIEWHKTDEIEKRFSAGALEFYW